MINASGFKAEEKTIQFLGRLVRLHKSKSKAYLDDIQYPGYYLGRHSRARIRSYKKQGYKVINVAKDFKKQGVIRGKEYKRIPEHLFEPGKFERLCRWCERHR
jgi:superfamily II DNA or RNA helicase